MFYYYLDYEDSFLSICIVSDFHWEFLYQCILCTIYKKANPTPLVSLYHYPLSIISSFLAHNFQRKSAAWKSVDAHGWLCGSRVCWPENICIRYWTDKYHWSISSTFHLYFTFFVLLYNFVHFFTFFTFLSFYNFCISILNWHLRCTTCKYVRR